MLIQELLAGCSGLHVSIARSHVSAICSVPCHGGCNERTRFSGGGTHARTAKETLELIRKLTLPREPSCARIYALWNRIKKRQQLANASECFSFHEPACPVIILAVHACSWRWSHALRMEKNSHGQSFPVLFCQIKGSAIELLLLGRKRLGSHAYSMHKKEKADCMYTVWQMEHQVNVFKGKKTNAMCKPNH